MNKDFYQRLHDLTLNVIQYVDAMLKRGNVPGEDLPFVTHLRGTSAQIHQEAKNILLQLEAPTTVSEPLQNTATVTVMTDPVEETE